MRTIGFCAVCLFAVVSSLNAAVPTAAECKAAREKLAELTADDYKAQKAKKKTNEQVGDALVGYADNEESAAGKFALLQDAFYQYVLGKSVEKAEDVYSKAQSIGGVEYAVEMARPSRLKLSAYATAKNPPAKALKERIAADEKSLQRVGIVKAKLKKSPGDESLCEQLGVEYAAIGDWESALAAFVTAAGEVAKVADWELNGGKGPDYTAATVGAFWWKFAENFPKRKNVDEAMKLHAAIWYKLALDKDSFKGNEKTIIEKRIAETESFIAAEQAEKELAAKKMAALDPIKLEFSKDNVVELIGCPAGEFMMGKKGDEDKNSLTRYHKVKITRSFWMSKFKVTHKVWNAYQKVELNEEDALLGGWNRIHIVSAGEVEGFFEWLNRFSKFKRQLPKGYVFRLPTEAEWEYALNAGCEDENDPYVMNKRDGEFSKMNGKIIVEGSDATARDTKNILRGKVWIGCMDVGMKQPNAWGFHDMLGSGGDLTLDTFDVNIGNVIKYADEETDPLRFFSGTSKRWLSRSHMNRYPDLWWYSWWHKAFEGSGNPKISIHIVLGPDLMKEKGYDPKTQKKR